MQIVIEVTDAVYQRAVDLANNSKENTFNSFIYNSIKDGTPLPKGHGRLKDTDKLDVGETFDEDGNRLGYKYVTKYELDNLPTIIEADKE